MGNDPTSFASVSGMNAAKEALLLLAVAPSLRGVLIASEPGRGKSLLARSFRSLFEENEDVPFVEISNGITEDRLLGGIDLERTLQYGAPRLMGGLLARAHRGFLVVNEANLLEERFSRSIARALASGEVRLEREGISATLPSEFAMIGTYDPNEGEVSACLRDAVGLSVSPDELTREDRLAVLRRDCAFNCDSQGAFRQWAGETARLRAGIAEARRCLPEVTLGVEDQIRLSRAAVELGVEGHRADIFAAKVARAHAALSARIAVEEEDLAAAIQLVILPRASVRPASAHAGLQPNSESQPSRDSQIDEPPPEEAGDLLTQTLDGQVPSQLVDTVLDKKTAARKASEGRKRSIDALRKTGGRGRFVRAIETRPADARIALEATLRAAVQRGMPGAHRTSRLRVEKRDLRFQQRKPKCGILIVFALDTSGSMAMNRISQAKGAILRLLREAYLHRDKVALVSFRGNCADVVIPPTRSVELARRALDAIPAGGGTPLARGLEAALNVARIAGRNDPRQTVLVLLTDGTPNVAAGASGSREAIWREVEAVSSALRAQGLASVVIDTLHWAVSRGDGERLAGALGARYVRLPRPDGDSVYQVVAATAGQVRR